MNISKDNQVLKKITKKIYDMRPQMPPDKRTHYRIERANGGLLCDLWFLTRGCMHDAGGGCTMCNYGKASDVIEQERMLAELHSLVRRFPWEFEDFLLTPSGSMLDEREVPEALREKLKTILKAVKARRFIIETRADAVSEKGLEFLRTAMPSAEPYVEIGYESGDDWILRNCINKGTDTAAFERAAHLIHQAGAKVTANIAVGIPFFSERASVNEAVSSIKKAFMQGADSVVLFPYHVKHGTLLEVMYQKGWYRCVSLWALPEVLSRFPDKILEQIQISWYKDYFGADRSHIFVSPHTCEACRKDVLGLLDAYREEPSAANVAQLMAYTCACRERWRDGLQKQAEGIEWEKTEAIYRALAEMYGIDSQILEEELSVMKTTIRGFKDADKC